MGHSPPPGQSLAKANLQAYVMDFGEFKGKATAFNFSIDVVNFESEKFNFYCYFQHVLKKIENKIEKIYYF